MARNWSIESKTLIEPRGGGVSQWMTQTPVENSTPSSTFPVPETPETSCSRRMVKRCMPDGARSTILFPPVQQPGHHCDLWLRRVLLGPRPERDAAGGPDLRSAPRQSGGEVARKKEARPCWPVLCGGS